MPPAPGQATAKLSAAEGAGSAAERDALVGEALQGLLAVPQCVNLAEFVPRLAFLRQYKVSRDRPGGVCRQGCSSAKCRLPHVPVLPSCCHVLFKPWQSCVLCCCWTWLIVGWCCARGAAWRVQGVVELVVKVAQLSDPHSLAALQGSTSDVTAARAARSRAYQHLLGVLKPLVTGTPTLAAPVGAAAAAAGSSGGAGAPASGTALTAGETKAAKEAIIQVGGCGWVCRP